MTKRDPTEITVFGLTFGWFLLAVIGIYVGGIAIFMLLHS